MASEWEDLEKLTKEELIIELVKERTAHRELCRGMRELIGTHPADDEGFFIEGEGEEDWPGKRTTDGWAEKIILYAKKESGDPEFDPSDAMDYGLNGSQADEAFGRLAGKGIVDWPSDDPRSKRFSGISGYTADEVAAMDPEEREERIRQEREMDGDGQE